MPKVPQVNWPKPFTKPQNIISTHFPVHPVEAQKVNRLIESIKARKK